METLFLLTIILFIYYLVISKKKNSFVTSNTEETELNNKLKQLIDAIELKIKDNNAKKISEFIKSKETEIEEEDVKPKTGVKNNVVYKEYSVDNNDVYYSFKLLNDKIYYSNILEGCDKKNIIENINSSYSLYSYIVNLVENLLIYSNKHNNTSFTVINIYKFKRIKTNVKTNYIIEAFLLDYKKYISHKYPFWGSI